MDAAAVDKQMEFLQGGKTLAGLAGQRYRLEDAECKKILLQEPGVQKRKNFRNFENAVLADGVAAYFEQLGKGCDVLFAMLDEAGKAAHEQREAETTPENAKMSEMAQNDKRPGKRIAGSLQNKHAPSAGSAQGRTATRSQKRQIY